MKRLVLFLTLVLALTTAFLVTASPAAAHCLQAGEAGLVDLSPGHFAAAGGHTQAIEESGILLPVCPQTGFVNEPAPAENPPNPLP
jgi:ABC-type branched-subunit amino acid transport system permease subunit